MARSLKPVKIGRGMIRAPKSAFFHSATKGARGRASFGAVRRAGVPSGMGNPGNAGGRVRFNGFGGGRIKGMRSTSRGKI